MKRTTSYEIVTRDGAVYKIFSSMTPEEVSEIEALALLTEGERLEKEHEDFAKASNE